MDRRDVMALFVGVPFGVTCLNAVAQANAELPVETLFKKPSFVGAVLSPDRKQMAALLPADGRYSLAVYDLEKRSAASLTNLSGSDVNSVSWANDRRVIFTTGDHQG